MSTVYINIGLPGSGKSTWSTEFAKENPNVIIINRDAFRSMIKGGDYIFHFKYEPFIKQATNKVIEQALEYGLDIVVDETHIKRERREEVIRVIRNFESSFGLINHDYGKTNIIYNWFTESERNLEYRMKDARGYESDKWDQVIRGMIDAFEVPTLAEGCDKLVKFNPLEVKNELA